MQCGPTPCCWAMFYVMVIIDADTTYAMAIRGDSSILFAMQCTIAQGRSQGRGGVGGVSTPQLDAKWEFWGKIGAL